MNIITFIVLVQNSVLRETYLISINTMILILNFLYALDFIKGTIDTAVFTNHVLSLGGSNVFIGMLGTGAALISFMWKPIAGRISDSIGSTKVIPWCLFINAIGYMAIGFSSSLNLIFMGKILSVIGSSVPALLNTILTTLQKEDRTTVLNKMSISASLAVISGGFIEGFISDYGAIYAYLLISTLNYFAIGLVYELPESKPPKKPKKTKHIQGFQEYVKSALNDLGNIIVSDRYRDLFAVKGCLEIMYSLVQMNFVYMLSVVYNLNGQQMGYVLAFFGLCGIITNFIMMKLNRSIYPEDNCYVKLMYGSLMMTLSYFGFYLTTGAHLHLFFGILSSISRAVIEPAVMGLILEKVEETNKGMVMSSIDSLRSLIAIVTPILTSIIVEFLGPKGVFPCSAFLSIVVFSISTLRTETT